MHMGVHAWVCKFAACTVLTFIVRHAQCVCLCVCVRVCVSVCVRVCVQCPSTPGVTTSTGLSWLQFMVLEALEAH